MMAVGAVAVAVGVSVAVAVMAGVSVVGVAGRGDDSRSQPD